MCSSAQALDQGGRSVALRHARIKNDKRLGAELQSLVEGSFDAMCGHIEYGEVEPAWVARSMRRGSVDRGSPRSMG